MGRGERCGIQKQPQGCVGNDKGGLKGLPPEKVAMGAGACRLARIQEASRGGLSWEIWYFRRWGVLDTLSVWEPGEQKLGD